MIALDGRHDLHSLGVMIRQRRLELGWSQRQLAERAGVSQGSLSIMEQSGVGMRLERVVSVLSVVGLLMLIDERSAYVEKPT